ncbi:MAG TPA: dihydroxyacetone kinase subunit DhaK [Solirubrobacteraceae bacterium]|nr:dihydroxyacetone kinase subunit DhaK [Solirubrobacteraceae bacterium]
MKKILGDPETLVDQSLAGFARAHAVHVRADTANRLCVRREAPVAGKVALISGGGSGHEPLHAGFVGAGMLDAAVLGDVFASPTTDQVIAAINATDSGAGVLLIIKNYTGDVINFRSAAGEAGEEGHEVQFVVVDDDVATRGGAGTGGRGTAATVFVEKIAGAIAERGAPLAEVAAVARAVVERSRSIGIALEACTTPMAGRPTFELGPDEIEFGVGIHGEAGIERRPHGDVSALAEQMLTTLLEGEPLASGPVIVLVNGFGATPAIELYLLFDEVARLLEARGFEIARSLVGDFVTSLDMAGASITLLALDEELLELWDAPVATATLNW